jgi:hypothetical protein
MVITVKIDNLLGTEVSIDWASGDLNQNKSMLMSKVWSSLKCHISTHFLIIILFGTSQSSFLEKVHNYSYLSDQTCRTFWFKLIENLVQNDQETIKLLLQSINVNKSMEINFKHCWQLV